MSQTSLPPSALSILDEERLREAVAAGVVPTHEILTHIGSAADRARYYELSAFIAPPERNYKAAARYFRLAADLCQHLAGKDGRR